MVMPAYAERRWTAREVRALIEAAPLATPRYELVDGELLVTPGPSSRHQFTVGAFYLRIAPYVMSAAIGRALFSPSDVELEPEDIRQPDVYVIPTVELRRIRREGDPQRQLILAIEVLSPSSSRHDRVKKRPGYQRHVAEYWIVDLEARLVEIWRPNDDRPEIVTTTLTWVPVGAVTALTIDLPTLFAEALDV
jgi:Uma2 family endonuclease